MLVFLVVTKIVYIFFLLSQAYKQYMIRKFEFQQRENAEILRKKKEAAAQGQA